MKGVWGPVTSTLDWCEENYLFTTYIAELANTVSNIATVGFAAYGAYQISKQKLPAQFLVGWLAIATVGLGSTAFHATLLYSAQLADELPMIISASWNCFNLFDTSTSFNAPRSSRTTSLLWTLLAFNISFAYAYSKYRNPVFHQVVFATLMLTIAFRTEYLMRYSRKQGLIAASDLKQLASTFRVGASTFIFAFFIWNLDNIFCVNITEWKYAIGWPSAFLLEGHAWWHILTAIGSYLLKTGTTYITLCIRDPSNKYRIVRNSSISPPIIVRVDKDKRTE